MKKIATTIFLVLIGIVLIGKISNWFLHYDDTTNKALNTAMFCLIGVAYLAIAIGFKKLLLNIVFGLCGIYLIIMNFIPDFGFNAVLGIVCVIIPMIIGKFLPKKDTISTAK